MLLRFLGENRSSAEIGLAAVISVRVIMPVVMPVTSCRGYKPDCQQGKQGDGFHDSSSLSGVIHLRKFIDCF